MKKILFLMAVALVAFTACQKKAEQKTENAETVNQEIVNDETVDEENLSTSTESADKLGVNETLTAPTENTNEKNIKR